MNLVIIDYGAGNVQSVKYAFNRLGINTVLSEDKEAILSADKVIFPGVGSAPAAMTKLHADGLVDLIPNLKQPVLGICLGMQLMCNSSEEGNTKGLGIFDTDVKLFKGKEKVPHMGWNNVGELKGDLFAEFDEEKQLYFVHSYYVPVIKETTAVTDYILPFSAALQKDNFHAFQFHPEKSSVEGEGLLKKFIEL